MEQPRPEPAFNTPGWRRKLSWGPYLYNPNVVGMQNQDFWMERAGQMPGSPGDLSKAIGWTLTGTMNSPNTNLAWHYPSDSTASTSAQAGGAATSGQQPAPASTAPSLPGYSMIGQNDFDPQGIHFPAHMRTTSTTSQPRPNLTSYPTNESGVSNHDSGDMMMGLNQNYQPNNHPPTTHDVFAHLHPTTSNDTMASTPHHAFTPAAGAAGQHTGHDPAAFNSWNYPNLWNPNNNMQAFGDMMIESQDVDMSVLGLDMMPWFDSYLPPHDLTGFFDPNQHGGHEQTHGAGPGVNGHGSGHQGTPQG
jgi:hypothetical protein